MAQCTKGFRLKKILIMAMLFTNLSGIFISQSEAKPFLMGGYIDISTGSGNYELEDSDREINMDLTSGDTGFTLDTDTTYQSFFNYRLNIGLKTRKIDDEFNTSVDLPGISLENIFAFAFDQGPGYRWWGGPLFLFGFNSGTGEVYYDDSGTKHEDEYFFGQLGIGLVTGINFKAGNYTTLAPSMGVRVIGGPGSIQTCNEEREYRRTCENVNRDEDFFATHTEIFASLAVLF
ncbi:MAG: hypothetical protein Q3M30_02655 [Candidatus Electrothrix sp. Rat3]|nr:hypothetical protein [Candidatus Electrothrix rattekaaiensis]